jgi:hypothetical protein
MKLTTPTFTLTIPTFTLPTFTNPLTKLRTRKPQLPLPHALHLLNLELQEHLLHTHSAHVSQARYHHLSQTYNVTALKAGTFHHNY